MIPDTDPVVIDRDTTLASLTITGGAVTRLEGGAKVVVTGDVTIDGTLDAIGGPAWLEVGGNLTVDGVIQSENATAAGNDGSQSVSASESGIFLLVDGDLTLTENAVLSTSGSILVTDDATQLAKTPADLWEAGRTNAAILERHTSQDPIVDNVTISGFHDNSGKTVKEEYPFVNFLFTQAVSLTVKSFTYRAAKPQDGAADDKSGSPGIAATGQPGGGGVAVSFESRNGTIFFEGESQISPGRGGDGGKATAIEANATGGYGGSAGYLRMWANSVDLTNGTIKLFPPRGGQGGSASILRSLAAKAVACPAGDGAAVEARGGNAGPNTPVIAVRESSLIQPAKISIGDVRGGHGGDARADAPHGGDGGATCSGGTGGLASAIGGSGGDADFSFGTSLGFTFSGTLFGGYGGDAIASAGWGGNGAYSETAAAGNGGQGGRAEAIGGAGGSTFLPGIFKHKAGSGGDASSIGGTGGNGGNTNNGTPGIGGEGDVAEAWKGAAGTPNGVAGIVSTTAGNRGADGVGNVTPGTTKLRINLDALPAGNLAAGEHDVELIDQVDVVRARLRIRLELADALARVSVEDAPVRHLRVTGRARVIFLLSTLTWVGQALVEQITGWNFRLLSAVGVSVSNPVTLDFLVNGVSLFGGPTPVVTAEQMKPTNPDLIEEINDAVLRAYVLPQGESIDEAIYDIPGAADVDFLEWSMPLGSGSGGLGGG